MLGVPVDASPQHIRKAYRQLQKKYHPDIAGEEGHAMTVLLNEAYRSLMSDHERISQNVSSGINGQFTGSAYSSWNGPDRPQALFVDEVTCIGCRECVFHASNTFHMDEALGCARVKVQYGDDEAKIKVSVDSCPVNCIHWVDREDLAILEFLARPHPRASNGIFGGGWERPSNVFMAANTYKRKLKEKQSAKTDPRVTEETIDQRKARVYADLRIKMGSLWWLWSWMKQFTGIDSSSTKEEKSDHDQNNPRLWETLFSRSSTSELAAFPVDSSNVRKTVGLIKEWANTFASSSEVPLPMPFRVELLENGVQLGFIDGNIECVGSLVVTVEQLGQLPTLSNTGETTHQLPNWFVYVRRQDTTTMHSLPGEGRIVKDLRKHLLGRTALIQHTI